MNDIKSTQVETNIIESSYDFRKKTLTHKHYQKICLSAGLILAFIIGIICIVYGDELNKALDLPPQVKNQSAQNS